MLPSSSLWHSSLLFLTLQALPKSQTHRHRQSNTKALPTCCTPRHLCQKHFLPGVPLFSYQSPLLATVYSLVKYCIGQQFGYTFLETACIPFCYGFLFFPPLIPCSLISHSYRMNLGVNKPLFTGNLPSYLISSRLSLHKRGFSVLHFPSRFQFSYTIKVFVNSIQWLYCR